MRRVRTPRFRSGPFKLRTQEKGFWWSLCRLSPSLGSVRGPTVFIRVRGVWEMSGLGKGSRPDTRSDPSVVPSPLLQFETTRGLRRKESLEWGGRSVQVGRDLGPWSEEGSTGTSTK